MGKGTLLCDHMETEQEKVKDQQSIEATSQDKSKRTKTETVLQSKKTWFHYRFDSLVNETIQSLEKALAQLHEDAKYRRRMDLVDIMSLNLATHKIQFELLTRRNPEVRRLYDALRANGLRKIAEHKQWEKDILATEGEEGLKRRKQNGEDPIHHYTREELDMQVRIVELQVEAGICTPADLKHAIEEREVGGYYQWEKERRRKNDIANIQELVAVNDSDIATVTQNIFRLNEDKYGKDYAERQHAILTEIAVKAPQNTASMTTDSTTG